MAPEVNANTGTYSKAILANLWAGDYVNYDGDVSELFDAASQLLGRELTPETLTVNTIAEVSTLVQADYWTAVDPSGNEGRADHEAAAEAGRMLAVEAFPPQNSESVPVPVEAVLVDDPEIV